MYCANCGFELEERSKFCKMCGTPVNSNSRPLAPSDPVQTPVQNGTVKNNGVLPLPLYIIGLIFNGLNLFLDSLSFLLSACVASLNAGVGHPEVTIIAFVAAVCSGIASVIAFVAILMGILNRAKTKNGAAEDKSKSKVAFIVLTCICVFVSIIGLYLLGMVMGGA